MHTAERLHVAEEVAGVIITAPELRNVLIRSVLIRLWVVTELERRMPAMFCGGGAKREPLKCSQTKKLYEELVRKMGGNVYVKK